MAQTEKIEIQISKDFAAYKAGDIIRLDGSDGLPLDAFWQRRLRDAEVDGCCELVQAAKKAKAKGARSRAEVEEID